MVYPADKGHGVSIKVPTFSYLKFIRMNGLITATHGAEEYTHAVLVMCGVKLRDRDQYDRLR